MDCVPALPDDGLMNPDQNPERLPRALAAEAQLQAWLDLKERLQQLHAQLEYVRLMLKLRRPKA